MEVDKEKTMFDYNVEIQFQYDRCNFTKWCYNLFELNERLHLELKLTHKSLMIDKDYYLMRLYFVTLWELLYNGRLYIDRQIDKDEEKHLVLIKQLIQQILEECCDDDYFMIQYYRNCASHIFLTRYSPLDKNGNAKKQSASVPFYKRNDKGYKMTYSDVLKKVEQVYGGKLGISLEPTYKKKLVERLYSIIHDAYLKLQAMDAKDTHDTLNAIWPYLSGCDCKI